jgi:hypothetical protein
MPAEQEGVVPESAGPVDPPVLQQVGARNSFLGLAARARLFLKLGDEEMYELA